MDAPGAGKFGRFVSLIGHMGADRHDAATEIATELRSVLPSTTDPPNFDQVLAALARRFGSTSPSVCRRSGRGSR